MLATRNLAASDASLGNSRSGLGEGDSERDNAIFLTATLKHAHKGFIVEVSRHSIVAALLAGRVNDNLNLLEPVEAKVAIIEADEALVGEIGLVVQRLAAGVEELDATVVDALVHVDGEEALLVDGSDNLSLQTLAQDHHITHRVVARLTLRVANLRMLLAERADHDILVRQYVSEDDLAQLHGQLHEHASTAGRWRSRWMLADEDHFSGSSPWDDYRVVDPVDYIHNLLRQASPHVVGEKVEDAHGGLPREIAPVEHASHAAASAAGDFGRRGAAT